MSAQEIHRDVLPPLSLRFLETAGASLGTAGEQGPAPGRGPKLRRGGPLVPLVPGPRLPLDPEVRRSTQRLLGVERTRATHPRSLARPLALALPPALSRFLPLPRAPPPPPPPLSLSLSLIDFFVWKRARTENRRDILLFFQTHMKFIGITYFSTTRIN